MPDATAAITVCSRCGSPLPPGVVACPNCGVFVHLEELQQISREALQLEAGNPAAAAGVWQRSLALLPVDSPQYHMIQQRIGTLAAGFAPPPMMTATNQKAVRPPDSLSIALLKTIGSMVVSIAVYAMLFHNLWFAIAFVVLMLVHEMGHVIANRMYGLSASPPIFIPFLGAVINLRQRPANAKVEAVIGIGGPILGTVGAIGAYIYAISTGSEVAYAAAHWGFLLNLFNLIPVPPLDGGRITAAVSPWIWIAGLAGLAWMFFADLQQGHHDYILILVLIYAFPRIKATLRGRDRFSDYYKISRTASWSIGTVYVALGLALLYLSHITSMGGVMD